jgi:membrane-bound lytic murein transglycosylase D
VNFPVHIPAEQVQTFTENYYEIAPDKRVEIPAEHLVREGETVVGIASAYGVDARDLMELNDLRDPNQVPAGTVLRIPGGAEPGEPGAVVESYASAPPASETLAPAPEVERETRTHRVARGETLAGISRAYGVSIDEIRSLNGIRGDKILVGQVLRIP